MTACPVHSDANYRCTRCGGCYQCEHQRVDMLHWRCLRDNQVRPAILERVERQQEVLAQEHARGIS